MICIAAFIKEQKSSATDTSKLRDEAFFARQTDKPTRITVTFDDLSEEAKVELPTW